MNCNRVFTGFICLFIGLWILALPASADPTLEVKVTAYDTDGSKVLGEKIVSIEWMEKNLAVQGDGKTHYYHQGPVFSQNKTEQWDREETKNFKDRGAVKGTDVRDLCNLVGGMSPGDEVMIKAIDGYHIEFSYPNIYTPLARQGPIVLCWFNGEDSSEGGERDGTGYPPDYYSGMRLVFFADNSTNPDGKHVFGNWDMHEVMPEKDIHLFENLYPSTSGYTVKWVDEIRVYKGGYHGEPGTIVKSVTQQPVTTPSAPQKSGVPPASTAIAFIAGLGIATVYSRR